MSYGGSSAFIGNNGGTSTLNISGGTFTGGSTFFLGVRGSSTLNVSNSATMTLTTLEMGHPSGNAVSNVVNLGDGTNFTGGTNINNGGTSGVLALGSVVQGLGTSTFNFNGGTLRATVVSANFLTGLTSATVQNAGGIIDNSGFAIGIGQALLHGGSNATDGGMVFNGTGVTTLTRRRANSYNGNTTVNNGTLIQNFSGYTTTPTDHRHATLTLNSANFQVLQKSATNTTDTFGNLVLNGGANTLTGTQVGGSGALTINLGSITRNNGAYVNFNLPTGGSITSTRTNDGSTGTDSGTGIYGNWATVTGASGTADWAANDGSNNLVAYTFYSTMVAGTSDTNNDQVAGNLTLTVAHTPNTLKVASTGAGQSLALSNNLVTIGNGGLLMAGTNAYTISGTAGTTELTAGSTSNYQLIAQAYNTVGTTISAVIGDNVNDSRAVSLVKVGSGILTLSASNTYTGGTTIYSGGALAVSNNNALGTGTLTLLTGGALNVTANLTLANNVSIASGNNGTLENGGGATTGILTGNYAGVGCRHADPGCQRRFGI